MPDQGQIGWSRILDWERKYDPLTYASADVRAPFTQNATISGTTKIEGAAVGGIQVFLIWRPTMVTIKSTISAADGTYSFPNIGTPTTNYLVYAKDPVGGTVYNDLVFALIDTA